MKTIVAIGTSTGGPSALQKVLTDIPEKIDASILIVQHMPKGFTKSLANRLDQLTAIHVKEASDNEVLEIGTVYIAPGDFHLTAAQNGKDIRVKLSIGPLVNVQRPAVDTLFQSIANLKNINKIAVVLTSMGKDGSKGIIQLKQKDKDTVILAESEKTAVVNGMPKSAIKTGFVNDVIPLDKIGGEISRLITELS